MPVVWLIAGLNTLTSGWFIFLRSQQSSLDQTGCTLLTCFFAFPIQQLEQAIAIMPITVATKIRSTAKAPISRLWACGRLCSLASALWKMSSISCQGSILVFKHRKSFCRWIKQRPKCTSWNPRYLQKMMFSRLLHVFTLPLFLSFVSQVCVQFL